MNKQPIGVFDSGYGGLTVLHSLQQLLPQYDYLYLGDNARAPYGDKSFESVYQYSLEAVKWFFDQGCHLLILACNTASAKALRTIQQNDLPGLDIQKRVLGVIRPTAEVIGHRSLNKHIAVLGTQGTVQSDSYPLEIKKFFPDIHIVQQACPMWVPLIENNEYDDAGADYFVEKYIKEMLAKDPKIDQVLLACTHYPLLMKKIKAYLPGHIQVTEQGTIVAKSLKDYLRRHTALEQNCSKHGETVFCTTGDKADFESHASRFFGKSVRVNRILL